MKIKIIITFLLVVSKLIVNGQTFNGSGGAIPDNGTSIDFSLTVSGLPVTIDTINFGLEQVCFDILHTWDSDLDISIIAPDGTMVLLSSGNGGGDDNYIGTCMRQDATASIVSGTAPFTGIFRPQGQLGLVNNMQDPNGVWTLHIHDTYPFADTGFLLDWSIQFGTNPATAFSLSSSNLPLVLINTNGQSISSDPKITARMKIIDNGSVIRNYPADSANGYDGFIGIDIRGHSSQGFPQKQFGVETRDSAGNNLNVSILGMPAENDWVLYAPWNDKTLMRNALTYSLANDMGRYTPRGQFCEVILNGEYIGVYTFFEKIKKDNNRVNISGLTLQDTTGDELTGGYICSVDWVDNGGWTSAYPPDPTWPNSNTMFYQYIYPKDVNILPQQQTYIQQYVDSFETALLNNNFADADSGWRQFGNEGSFIDYFLMNELSKNVDGYRLSSFFYKNKNSNGGKINMGPLWDFNLAWHNADYCANNNPGGWAYLFNNDCQWDFPFWWRRLNEDSTFVNNVRCRWDDLRTTIFDTTYMFNYIDSIAFLVDEAQQRHYTIYPILGTYLWPNPSPIPQTYIEEISFLKSWIVQRVTFMDDSLPGSCSITTGMASVIKKENITLSPNPATELVTIDLGEAANASLTIYNAVGNIVQKGETSMQKKYILNVSHLSSGVYFVTIRKLNQPEVTLKFIKI